MRPILLFPIALLTPLVLAATLLMPVYAGFLSSVYAIYYKAGQVNPVASKFTDVFYIFDVYNKLFHYWLPQMKTLDLVHFTLPLLGLPALGIIIALWLTIKISRMMLNMFHLTTSY